mgnify:CR=1 FL=1
MPNHVLTALLLFLGINIFAQTYKPEPCPYVQKNDYSFISENQLKLKVDKKKLFLTEVKYECAYSAMYTAKVMFDKYGIWDEVLYPRSKKRPVFLWRNVQLFPKDTRRFNIAVNGRESTKTIFASVLVFDNNGADLLAEDSPYKEELVQHFASMINNEDANKREFYEHYWKLVNPEHWQRLEQYHLNVVEERRCLEILKNSYKTIILDSITSVVDNKTIYLRELKYECVYTSFYTKKGMFDRFGKWDQEIFLEGEYHPILLWQNVRLFPDDPKTFNVAATGDENMSTIYASVLVSDSKNRDMLAEGSEYKDKLITYFSEMIRSNKPNKRKYYDVYWKKVKQKKKERDKNQKD